MNKTILIITMSVLTLPLASFAIGFGGYYSIGFPFVDYDSLGCETDFRGANVKAWYSFSDEISVELSSGIYKFQIESDSQLDSGDVVGSIRPWNLSLGVIYRIRKYGRLSTYINGGGGYYQVKVQDDRLFIPENLPKITYENPGIYIGGGLKAWLGGPLYADVNPVFSYIFDVDNAPENSQEQNYLNRLYMFAINIGLAVDF